MAASHYEVAVNRNLTERESDGKWDFEVTVKRKRDGLTKSLKGSGGEVLIDAMIARLIKQLRAKRR